MLNLTRIHHICQVVPALAPQTELLEGLFGFRCQHTWTDEGQGHRGALFGVPGRSGVAWQVLEPTAAEGPLRAFLDSPRGPGLHHVAVEVPALEAALTELQALGIAPAARAGNGGEAWADVSLVPPGGPAGLMFRLVEGAAADAEAPPAPGAGLGIVAVDHVCQAYRDRDELARLLERVLGMQELWRTPDGKHEDLADLVLRIPGEQMFWEIIQPVGEGSFIGRFLETRGAAAHHATFEVADWDKAMAACEQAGIPTFDPNSGETDGAHWNDAFIHPKHTGGVLVQLFWEEKPGVWVRSDKIPSGR